MHSTTGDQAREWLIYLFSEDATDEGRARFSGWLNEKQAHRQAFEKAERVWRHIGLSDGVADLVDEFDLEDAKNNPGTRGMNFPVKVPDKGRIVHFAVIAATLFILISSFMTWRVFLYDPVETVRYIAGVAETKTVRLADGSVVTLGGNSEIIVSLSRQKRAVELTQGSAFFDVERDEDRPFSVTTSRTQVRVLGTAFGIRRGPLSVRVSVTEGHVEVADLPVDRKKTDEDKVQLVAGEQITASLDGAIVERKNFDQSVDLAWLESRFVYDGTSLYEVIADVNRYRVKKITIEDPALRDIKLTTSFRVTQTDQMLAGLAATQPVIIERLPNRIIIRSKLPAEN